MDHILKCHEIIKTDFLRGENCYLYDAQGKRYIDFESGIWCTALGHNHFRINQIIKDQIDKLMHLGTRYPSQLAEEAAMSLLELAGFDEGKCIFLSSGSEAVEFAVQAARIVTKRNLFLAFSTSYLAAFGSAGRKSSEDWHLFNWHNWNLTDHANSVEPIPFTTLGGFAFEPGGSGSEFVQFPPKQLVQTFVQQVKQAGGLIVANEITTGMGRTGKWFGYQHYDIQPDLIALGKGLGNGYPVSAVVMKREVAEKLEESGFRYAQSHQNDPLGSAIAQEVISVLREEKWIEKGNDLGNFFLEELKQLETKHEIVKDARGRGMLSALEFHPHKTFSATTVQHKLLEKGFLVGCYPAGNMLRFSPALTISKDDLKALLDDLDQILKIA